MDMHERLKSAREAAGYKPAEVAAFLGITRSAVGQWESGKSTPNVDNLGKLAVRYGVNFEWLATGRGRREYRDYAINNPKNAGGVSNTAAVAEACETYGEETRVLRSFRQLSPPRRKALLTLIESS